MNNPLKMTILNCYFQLVATKTNLKSAIIFIHINPGRDIALLNAAEICHIELKLTLRKHHLIEYSRELYSY